MHNPPLQTVIDQLLAEACHNAAIVLSAGSPTHTRLKDAHDIAQQIDACLTPALGSGPLTISLVHVGGLEKCLAAIESAGLVYEPNISEQPAGPNGTRHEIKLRDHEHRVVAYTFGKEPA